MFVASSPGPDDSMRFNEVREQPHRMNPEAQTSTRSMALVCVSIQPEYIGYGLSTMGKATGNLGVGFLGVALKGHLEFGLPGGT